MKIGIVTLIFLLFIQNSYCVQNASLDFTNMYCLDSGFLVNVSSQEYSIYKLSTVGSRKLTIKSLLKSILGDVLRPYVYLSKQDLEYFAKENGRYLSCENQLFPYPDQLSKILLFIDKPDCGDLAFCIRQCSGYSEKRDSLLKLLDASHELEKLIYFKDNLFRIKEDKHGFSTHKNDDYGLRYYQLSYLVSKFYIYTDEQPMIEYSKNNNHYNLMCYFKGSFKRTFKWAKASYYISIIKDVSLILLMTDTFSNSWLRGGLYGTIVILIWLDLDKYGDCRNHQVFLHNLFFFCFIVIVYLNIENNKMYTLFHWSKIFSICSIGHASFYLAILYWKYNNFKKVMNEYKNPYKIQWLLKKHGERILL